MSSSSADGVRYTLTFVNNSSRFGTACLYQVASDSEVPDAQSLSWFTRDVDSQASVDFDWTLDYGFVCSQSGPLAPGKVFGVPPHLSANLTTTNEVTFSRAPSEAPLYAFGSQTAGPRAGSLYIHEDHTVRAGEASVGISMSGAGVFAIQAQPDSDLVFTPHPAYWLTFGRFQQGEVLDIGAIINSAKIDFPAGVYAMTVTLNGDDTFTVSP
jgi:rhizosphere induced protein